MNIKALCEQKEYRLWCKQFNKPAELNDLGEVHVPNLVDEPGIINSAFDILLRLTSYKPGEYHASLINAVANYRHVFGRSFKADFGVERTENIDVAACLEDDSRRDLYDLCYRLGICENFRRSLKVPKDLDAVMMKLEVAQIELEWLWSEYKSPWKDKYINSPGLRVGRLYGEPDVLTKDCVWDLKATSVECLKRDDYNRQVTYLLMARINKFKGDKIGFVFPRFNKIITVKLRDILTRPEKDVVKEFLEFTN